MKNNYVQSELLTRAGAINAVSMRVEDKSAMFSMKRNGTMDGPEAENRKEFFASLGFDASSVVRGEQVHGDNIEVANSALTFPETDGLLTRSRNLLLLISVADCVPVLLFDRRLKVAAAVHSGWKGTVKNIAGKAVELMSNELNSSPDDVVAFIGPSAGACCYEVGEDVAQYFSLDVLERTARPGKSRLDLKSAIASQLTEKGLPKGNIELSRYCSICNPNFHSFRRDGESSGRMLAAIAIK